MQAMDAIRASKGAEEARRHAATLQRLTAATRASMEQHVRAEEQEVCFEILPSDSCHLCLTTWADNLESGIMPAVWAGQWLCSLPMPIHHHGNCLGL